jgi:hypothetical protein
MSRHVPFIVGLAALAAVAAAPAATPLTAPLAAQPMRQRIDTVVPFSDGLVDVRSVSGPITITTWNRREAKISAYVDRGELIAEFMPARIRLEARDFRERGRRSMGEHEFVLTVPVGTRIEAHNVSGDISVRGTKAALSAESVSGDVDAEDGEGQVELATVSGDVRGARLSGTVRAQSVSGDVRLRDVAGALTVESVSGAVDLTEARATSLKGESVSGDLIYRGTLDARGRYALQSHSGDVVLVLAEGAKADISTKTFSGSIDSEFPLVTGGASDDPPRKRRDRMRFTLGGGGGATVELETFSGSINLRRPGAKPSRED